MGRKHKMGNHNQIPARPDEKMGKPSWNGHTAARQAFKKVTSAKRRRRDRGLV